MFVKGFFTRYWRYLLALICGCAVITTGPACTTRGGRDGGGSSLLIITSIATSNISSVGATISWSTNRPADSQVEYGVTTSYGNVVSLKTMDTNHQLTLFGLTSDTLYHYRVKSMGESGNLSTSGDLTFTTAKTSPGLPTISSFTASPGSITSGQSSVLSWSVTGATDLRLDPGNVTVTGLTSKPVAPTATTTYVLTATNSAGAVTRSVTVTVTNAPPPPPLPTISSFTASPGSITSGQSSLLSWSVTGATGLRLDPGNVTVTGLTSRSVAPTATTTYVLTATNSAGAATRSVTVTVTGNPTPTPTPFPIGGVDESVGPFASWTNVKTAYGARGDGVADDTASLQRGLDDLSSGGAVKTLFLPSGVYRITQKLRLHNTIYVNMIGEDPDSTIIRWDGALGGVMMHIDGVAYSRYNRLTWDGQNRADVAIDQSKSENVLQHFDTGNEYAEDVFKDVGYGIRAGNFDIGASETSVVRSRFIRNSKAGIVTKNFNALDWWVWYCYFEDCAIGVTNSDGAGNFSVFYSVFKRSSVADIMIEQTSFYSIRNNYSIGSKVFYNSPGAGQNGALTAIQGNTILDTQGPEAIQIYDFGPVIMYDNSIRSSVGASGPAIRLNVADALTFGNTFTVSNPITAGGRSITDGTRIVQRGDIVSTEPVIPFKYVSKNRQVFDVPLGATASAIQQKIDSAAQFCGQRPIVHLPAGPGDYQGFQIDKSLIVPPNCDIQIVGDGGFSRLTWVGNGSGPVFTLRGPSKAILRDFRIHGAADASGNGIVIENADQPGSRVYMQEVFVNGTTQNGLLVDGLDYTRVDLRGLIHQEASGSSVKVVGGSSAASGLNLGGRTTLISGASASNVLSYEVTQGGRLAVKDVWYETGGTRPGYIKLTGNGAVTFEQSRVFTIPVNTTPPAIDIQNYNGKATFIGLDLEDTIRISGTSSGSILGLGLMAHSPDYFFNNTAARAALVNSRWYNKVPPNGGSLPVANKGSFDPAFLLDMLTQTRGANLSNEYEAIPNGITDVRMFRVYAEKTLVGFHIQR